MPQLHHLRQQIDQLDQELIELFSKRLALVAEVGKVKHQHGLPIYAPEREAAMLQSRRLDAAQKGISPDLIEDVLRRLMRESYHNENRFGFKCANPAINKIVIVGGGGKLGGLFAQYLRNSGYFVAILERDDWQNAAQILADADVVMVSVPIANTLETLDRLQPYLRETMLLTDLTSIKRAPLEKMLAIHQGAVLGLHPMFGPDIPSMAKQVIVRCDGRFAERYQWLLQQMQMWGAQLYQTDAALHDQHMTYVQALRHFATFANGLHLSKQPVQLANLLALSSPIYRLELAMIGRLFAQDAALYFDIIADKAENLAVIESLQDDYENALTFFKNQDKAGFIAAFESVHQWFGEYSELFLKESQAVIGKMSELKNAAS